MSNWIKLHRKLTDWEWWGDPQTAHLFIHLLLKANFKESKWRGVSVKRGQLVTGRKLLNSETGISEQSIRTCLKRLEDTGEITSKPTNKFSIVTICNYDEYQGQEEASNQPANQQLTNNQPATNHIQEVKKGKKLKDNGALNETARAVIDYLNEKANKKFRHVSANHGLILSRLQEGYEKADFIQAIDNQIEEWSNDEKMSKFIRPETLFRKSKFDGYVNNTKTKKGTGRWI